MGHFNSNLAREAGRPGALAGEVLGPPVPVDRQDGEERVYWVDRTAGTGAGVASQIGEYLLGAAGESLDCR